MPLASCLIAGVALAGIAPDQGQADVDQGRQEQTGQDEPLVEEVRIAGETFKLEVAADDQSREHGLMGRKTIEPDRGMIFIFEHSLRRSFWMKNCITDIDLIFLDHRGRIVALHEMEAEPAREPDESETAYEQRLKHYYSRWPAQFAIELRKGTLDRLDLKIGGLIELDLKRLKQIPKQVREKKEEEEREDER